MKEMRQTFASAETRVLERSFTADQNRALETRFKARKYLSSAEMSMLAFNLAIPRNKVFI